MRFLPFVAGLLLVACSHQSATPTEDAGATTSEAATSVTEIRSSEARETKNVSYQGVVNTLGISIYMEGTHRLNLADGRFILLESDTKDLNGYVGETVTVVGALRPTVEADAMIMRVGTINLVSSATDEAEDDSSNAHEKIEESSASSAKEVAEEPVADVVEEATEEVTVADMSPAFRARIEEMAKQDFGASNWTQQYCSTHIGFCVPVHRNWWYRSFGATSSSLWHVEMNSKDFEFMGEGPIVVELHDATLASTGQAAGQVVTNNGQVTGYQPWDGDQHFIITADASLKVAVEYITTNLTSQPVSN